MKTFPKVLLSALVGFAFALTPVARASNVSGRITSNGAGVPGVLVTISQLLLSHTATTDSNGNYSATFTGTLDWTVTPSLAGFSFSPASKTASIPPLGGTVSGIDFAVNQGEILGRITSASGAHGVAGATVQIYSPGNGPLAMVLTTDSNGNYNSPPLSFFNAGYKVVPVLSSSTFSPASTTNGPGVPANFALTAGPIHVRVTSGSVGIGSVYVPIESPPTFDYTDANGDLTTSALPASGTFNVVPSLAGYTFSPASQTTYAGNLNVAITVITGPRTGHISPLTSGINGATVTLGTTTVTADSSGNFNLGTGSGGTVTVTKSGFTFAAPSQTIYPGVPLTFTITQSPPSISTPAAQTMSEDSVLAVNFSVSDLQTSAGSLAVTATSDNQSLVPNSNLLLSGTTGSRSVTITPVPNANGSANITLTVTDGNSQSTTTSFPLTVSAVNDPPIAGPGTSLRLNGTNYVTVPGFGSLAPMDEITIEFWQKADGLAVQNTFKLAPDDTNNRINAHIPWSSGTVYWDFGNINTGGRLSYTPGSIVGTWQHFALVASKGGNYMKIFRNGVEEASKAGMTSFTHVNSDLILGFFPGQLAEFRVWNVARSAAEIQGAMNGCIIDNTPNLVLYYRFNEGSGLGVRDSASLSANPNQLGAQNGTLVGSPIWQPSSLRPTNTVLVNEDTLTTLFLPAYDVDSAVLTWTNVTVSTGTVSQVSGGLWRYLPPTNYNGGVILSYQVTDGSLSATGSVNLSVLGLNDPPSISPIATRTVEENTGPAVIKFTVNDNETPGTNLNVYAVLSDTSIATYSLGVGLGGTNRTLTLTPIPGQIGTITIQVFVTDGNNVTASTTFDFKVESEPAFAIVDLGMLPGKSASFGTALNDAGAVVGYAADNNQGQNPLAFLFNGLDNGSALSAVGTFAGGGTSQPLGINGDNTIVGLALTNSQNRAFLKQGLSFGFLDGGVLTGGTNSAATAINEAGYAVGYGSITGGKQRAFLFTNGVPLASLGTLTAPWNDASQGFALNDLNQVAGAAYSATGQRRAFFYNGTTMTNLGNMPNDTNSVALGINNFGQIVGSSTTTERPDAGYALSFPGSVSDYVIQSAFNDFPSNAITVEFWMNTSDQSKLKACPFSYETASAPNTFTILNMTNFEMLVRGTQTVGTGISANDGLWHHIAITWTSAGGQLVIYKDGVTAFSRSGIETGNLIPGGGTLVLGQEQDSPGGGFDVTQAYAGQLDEVRIWNGARSAAQVQADMTSSLSGNEPGLVRAFHFDAGAGTTVLDSGPAGRNATLSGGVTWVRAANVNHSLAFLYDSTGPNGMSSLGTLPSGGASEARAINDFGQVAGVVRSSNNTQHAMFYSAGTLHDLNDLLSEEDAAVWQLTDANAINLSGAIAGTGTANGQTRAYLALPATAIGRPVIRPLGAVERYPIITILQKRQPDDNILNAFQWSDATRKLYAIRPVIAKIEWFTSFFDTLGSGTNQVAITNRIVTLNVNVWPKNPTIHIAGSPVEIEPQGVPFAYSFQSLLFSTNGSSVEPSSKHFTAPGPGYTVAYYLKTDGQGPNPQLQEPYFEVIRTFNWNDPRVLPPDQPWLVGDSLTNATHFDYLGKNGFVFFEHGPIDMTGVDKAYDRNSRLGAINPVNKVNPDPLVVVWYNTNKIGVAWASQPVKYSLDWPYNTANKIIIASALGSGSLDALAFPEKKVYNQPDPKLAGFNPNEEHALLAASSSGDALFALRCDLNAVDNFSATFALLKYKEPATGLWRIRAYQVIAEEAPYFFNYGGTAGNEIQPPLPLSVLPLCAASYGVSGPFWQDYKGKLYARAAGLAGQNTNIVLRYFYPLQAGFYFPGGAAQVGDCVAWLDRLRPNNPVGRPLDITYTIHWPDDAPVLQVGDSLLTARNGLPDIFNMANAQIIYDDLDPNDTGALLTLARMYDPISPRTLTSGVSIPSAIKLQTVNGKQIFSDLPFALKLHLSYDPLNHWLSFAGYLDANFGAGSNPLLLPNVLSERERDRVKDLAKNASASEKTAWGVLIDRLYDLTRNPHQVDLSPKDGQPDQALRLGLITAYVGLVTNSDSPPSVSAVTYQTYPSNVVVIATNVVPEQFGAGPKALTAGFGGLPPAQAQPGTALSFDGANDVVNVGLGTNGASINLAGTAFTVEFWARRAASGTNHFIFSQGVEAGNRGLHIGFRPNNTFLFAFYGNDLVTTQTYTDTNWHHWACTYDFDSGARAILQDGVVQASDVAAAAYQGSGTTRVGAYLTGGFTFAGQIDELRIWKSVRSTSDLQHNMNKRLFGSEDTLELYYRMDEGVGTATANACGNGFNGTLVNGVAWVTSGAVAGIPPRFLTVVENNNPALAGLPVGLKVIRIDDGPFPGDLKVLPGDNIFDERVTIRHSSDFGGDPGQLYFEWYYQPEGANFDPTDLPIVGTNGAITDARGWVKLNTVYNSETTGRGFNDVTIGEGSESSLITLSDNGFICRYKGYAVNLLTTNSWSGWIGDPSGNPAQPRAVLVEGWVKRVIRGLNPFDARTADFHSSDVNTSASMLIQAGHRYEGDIAFNPDADTINNVGLIEAYQTVLNRARNLSIDGTPAVDFNPVNNALLLAATKISDLYMVLGNEAYADAEDPTIGFSTATSGAGSSIYGTAASSIFAFQNQLDSLLEEELVLLRGRDDHAAGVGAAPVYNRLFWNFTLGEGEVAYQQNYNISDVNGDGFIDENDARILYPQGHGDAWGHYLTAIKTHYTLLRHPNFTWVPRAESVNVAGVAVLVDFLDERKFALAAAAKAKVGSEIVDLTYRMNYVDDPTGQWQGYKDTNPNRAWGVTEWARRAGQGAYFDWVTANTILPATDPDINHTGIQQIDRTTVKELGEIAAHNGEIQTRLDQADAGLNPLGLAKGVVPFDIDPTQVSAGKTHFEQIQDRANKAMNNAIAVWDEVNQANELLRRNQDTVEKFTANVTDQERDYKNRLIEIFGYPYAGDIGPGLTYPGGYDGPDLYHYMYVHTTDLNGDTAPPSQAFSAFFSSAKFGLTTSGNTQSGALGDPNYQFYFPEDMGGDPGPRLATDVLQVSYPLTTADFAFTTPTAWGERRAPGEIQSALSDLLQNQGRLKKALLNYDNIIAGMEAKRDLLQARYNLRADELQIKNELSDSKIGLGITIAAAKTLENATKSASDQIHTASEILVTALPMSVGLSSDVFSAVRGTIKAAAFGGTTALDVAAIAADTVAQGAKAGLDVAQGVATAKIEKADFDYEIQQQLTELEDLLQQEAGARVEVFTLRETMQQSSGRYLAALAAGQRLMEERVAFRQRTAAQTTESRYEDMTFRIFRNDALQKYRAQFDLAARYVYLAATAYDYEVNLLGTDNRSGSDFLTDIIRQRSLGQMINGQPVAGRPGLADPLARLSQNFDVLKSQLGFNNPETETGRFSLRRELFRISDNSGATNVSFSTNSWQAVLKQHVVTNLWNVPEFRRYCRAFAPESAGPQPGLVIRFPTTVTFGQNFFGWPLSGGDSAYDPSRFATKVRSVGVWFTDYNSAGLSLTPRVYLVPVGLDFLRSPSGDTLATRQWRIIDQAVPVPFPIGVSSLNDPTWIPINDSLGGTFADIRHFASFRAYHDSGGFNTAEATTDSRLIGRSVWNTDWMLIIPGGTLLNDPNQGLDLFIKSISDIKLFFQTYSYPGN